MTRLNTNETANLPSITKVERRPCVVCNKLMSVQHASRKGKFFKFTMHVHANKNGLVLFNKDIYNDEAFEKQLMNGGIL